MAYPYASIGYREGLARAFEGSGVELLYADERLFNDHVLHKIERMIAESDLSVFDLTGVNPNVMLELGVAIGGKHPYVVVLKRDAVEVLVSDIRGWDQLRYDTYEELGASLRDFIERKAVPAREARKRSVAEPELLDLLKSPLDPKPPPLVSLQRNPQEGNGFFGLHIQPLSYPNLRRVLDAEDDKAIERAEILSRGLSPLHGPLTALPTLNGVLLSGAETTPEIIGSPPPRPLEQIQLDSDGEIIIRFAQNDNVSMFQFLALLGTGYVLSKELYPHLDIQSQARFVVSLHLDARRNSSIGPKFPPFFQETAFVDFHKTFPQNLEGISLQLFRASGVSSSKAEVLAMLEQFETMHLSNPSQSP